jgi:sec-independent protein translocase protein TatA
LEDDMDLGPMEIGLIILAFLLLFGYKKLPDASRSLGRSLRIFKGEMKGMQDDGRMTEARTALPGEVDPSAEHLDAEARAAETWAAEARARADAARAAVTDPTR